MKPTEGSFIPHCDDLSCDLCSFWYECPRCNKNNIDYDFWWNMDYFYSLDDFVGEITCEHCREKLFVMYNKEDGLFIVS